MLDYIKILSIFRYDKKELRSYFLEKRNTLPAEIREELSVLICNHILSSAIWKKYDDIFMYVPFRSEVDILPLIDIAWREGKRYFYLKLILKTV